MPLPPSDCVRFHATADEGDDDVNQYITNLADYQCGQCGRHRFKHEMYVKGNGKIGVQCQVCYERQKENKLRRKL